MRIDQPDHDEAQQHEKRMRQNPARLLLIFVVAH